jgi:hypothetical protein
MLVWSPGGRVALPSAKVPGYRSGVLVGVSARRLGKVIGSLPEGLTSPNSRLAIAGPCCSPPYQVSSTDLTPSIQGISTALPVCSTTTVPGLAAEAAVAAAFAGSVPLSYTTSTPSAAARPGWRRGRAPGPRS